eukprot:m.241321 g.241321  ORF g.241321 m.241321 type:complete len:328 (+) comp24270_c0_seq1:163-1146(+)
MEGPPKSFPLFWPCGEEDRLTTDPATVQKFICWLRNKENRAQYRRPCNRTADGPGSRPCVCEFHVADDVSIEIIESTFFKAGLGYRIFPSALLLTDWLVQYREAVAGRSVLELGAGLGLPALAAASPALGARRVVLSDYMPELLRTLDSAARLNCAAQVRERILRVKFLDWAEGAAKMDRSRGAGGGNVAPMSQGEFPSVGGEKFDFIFAADVLYEPEYADWLPRVIAKHSTHTPTQDCSPATCAFMTIAPTRDMAIMTAFTNNLRATGMHVRVTSATEPEANRECIMRWPGADPQTPERPGQPCTLAAEEGEDCLIIQGWWLERGE